MVRLTEQLLLNEIPAPEQVASFSLILEEVAITLRRIRLDLPFCTPLNIFGIQVWMVLDPLRPLPKRKLKRDGLFNELNLREHHGLIGNGELPINILKLIGKRNFSSLGESAHPAKFLDQAFCRLFTELDKFNEQGKNGNDDVRL